MMKPSAIAPLMAALICLQGMGHAAPIQKIFFVGNSITRHAPSPKLNWTGNWGMAASSEANDYVHRLAALVQKHQGSLPEIAIHAVGGGTLKGKLANPETLTSEKADLIVVQMGENDQANHLDEFQNDYEALIVRLRSAHPDAKIVCTGTWRSGSGKDEKIRQTCKKLQIPFANIAPIFADMANRAISSGLWETQAGVAWHPGDHGMEAYANAIWSAVLNDAPHKPADTAKASFDVSDTFHAGTQGSSPLDGLATSAGGASWAATKNVLRKNDADRGSITTTDGRGFRAHVALPAQAGCINVTGEVLPCEKADRKNWVAIGLGAKHLKPTWEQGLFLLVDSGGSFEGFVSTENNGLVRLKRDDIPNYMVGKPVKLAIQYDPSTGIVNLSVNDIPVLQNKTLSPEQKPLTECAGFSGFAPKPGEPMVRSFRASVAANP